ncbi:MAG: tryptophan--tRNA ligase [Leadbetterella sp.]
MSRILTGIQASGRPHLGNILGAIKPSIELSKDPKNESFLFIADLHSLTTLKDPASLYQNTLAVANAWLSCGFDTEKNFFYRQSKLAGFHTELMWYLSCLTPFPMLANAHSFKDKSDKLSDINAGLFTYPILQAADIILYNAQIIPVGKDQKQHIEISRDIASNFNRTYGEVFVLPEARINESLMTIPGIDGQKMSKSLNNYIDIFAPEKELLKQVKKIVTDATPMEEPKNPDTCNVFKLYALIANSEEIETMREQYIRGGYGYGHAKTALFEKLMAAFQKEREVFTFYESHEADLLKKLELGEEKAWDIASDTMKKVRNLLKF